MEPELEQHSKVSKDGLGVKARVKNVVPWTSQRMQNSDSRSLRAVRLALTDKRSTAAQCGEKGKGKASSSKVPQVPNVLYSILDRRPVRESQRTWTHRQPPQPGRGARTSKSFCAGRAVSPSRRTTKFCGGVR